jgi:hypothetical protein
MKLEITFDELNTLIEKYTGHNISLKSLPAKNSFSARIVIAIFPVEVPLTFDRIIDGHKLAFDYKLPLGMNLIAGKFKNALSALIPGQITEVGRQQIIVHLNRIEIMERYFEHFEVSHFEVIDGVLQIQGKPVE